MKRAPLLAHGRGSSWSGVAAVEVVDVRKNGFDRWQLHAGDGSQHWDTWCSAVAHAGRLVIVLGSSRSTDVELCASLVGSLNGTVEVAEAGIGD